MAGRHSMIIRGIGAVLVVYGVLGLGVLVFGWAVLPGKGVAWTVGAILNAVFCLLLLRAGVRLRRTRPGARWQALLLLAVEVHGDLRGLAWNQAEQQLDRSMFARLAVIATVLWLLLYRYLMSSQVDVLFEARTASSEGSPSTSPGGIADTTQTDGSVEKGDDHRPSGPAHAEKAGD